MNTHPERVRLVDLGAGWEPVAREVRERWDRAMAGMQLNLGPNVREFEAAFCEFSGVPHGHGVASGTDALILGLRALGVGAGDEVITTPFTFFATVEAIHHVGARCVFADIDSESFLIDPADVAARVTPRTKAVIPVHVFGQCADVPAIRRGLPTDREILILEDAAEAHGARLGDARAGGLGDAAAFSFYFTKNLGAYGEGGFITTHSEELAARVAMLRNHGQRERFQHHAYGYNSRLDELQAAVLNAKLKTLEADNDRRKAIARIYDEGLADVVTIPACIQGGDHVYYAYVIKTPRRDELQRHLDATGIDSAIYWPIPAHLQPACADLGCGRGSLPRVEAAADQVLALPIYPQMTPDCTARVIAAVREFCS